jgi:hypothetical protein
LPVLPRWASSFCEAGTRDPLLQLAPLLFLAEALVTLGGAAKELLAVFERLLPRLGPGLALAGPLLLRRLVALRHLLLQVLEHPGRRPPRALALAEDHQERLDLGLRAGRVDLLLEFRIALELLPNGDVA